MVESQLLKNKSGSGLGLNLCQQLVVKMGGRVWFESKPNECTKFGFNIKAQETNSEGIVEESKVILKSRKVLIVDDNIMNVEIIQKYAIKAGVEYRCFNNSEDVIRNIHLLKGNWIGLLDLNMPQISGYELAEALKKEHHEMRLIAVTGQDRDSVLDICRAHGFDDAVEKPLSYDKFRHLI